MISNLEIYLGFVFFGGGILHNNIFLIFPEVYKKLVYLKN